MAITKVTAAVLDPAAVEANISNGSIDADKLDVTGNGTAGQALLSDGDGSFSWGSAGNTYTAGDGITLNTLEFDLDADLTTVTSIHNTALKIGRGATDDYISFAIDNQISSFIGNAEKMRLEADGDLHVDGDVVAASTTVSSDEKLKENIKPISAPLETLNQIKGVDFNFIKGGKKSSGVIAQDVQKVMPHLVKEVSSFNSSQKHLAVDYNGLIGLLIESVKELQKEVNTLKK